MKKAPSSTDAALSAFVKEILRRRDLKNEDLAAGMGLSPMAVSYKLSGQRRWFMDDVYAVAGFLGMEVATLLERSEKLADAWASLLEEAAE